MNGVYVGRWSVARGVHSFEYDVGWLESPVSRPLSLSLPLPLGREPILGPQVAHYFDNLLPDSTAIRNRVRSRFAADSVEAFDLLSVIGRDCVGAVQLLPEGETPSGFDRIEGESLSELEVERAIVTGLSSVRLGTEAEADDFRISLAGAQEKTALLYHKGRWQRPFGATPTTHILKLPMGRVGGLGVDMSDSVENEWLCLQLIQAMGLPAAKAALRQFGKQKVLTVERFDRSMREGWIARLPQEDFCQVLGVPSSRKYESDGGPGMRDILRVLDTSSAAMQDKRAFLKAQIVFWLLGAIDGHAKNFSVFIESGGSYRLTPFYDVISAWPVIGKGVGLLDFRKVKLAMAVRSKNTHWKLSTIRGKTWDATARLAGLSDAREILHEVATAAPKAVEKVASKLKPDFPADLSERIFEGFLGMLREL